jgi:hypothetical protein
MNHLHASWRDWLAFGLMLLIFAALLISGGRQRPDPTPTPSPSATATAIAPVIATPAPAVVIVPPVVTPPRLPDTGTGGLLGP